MNEIKVTTKMDKTDPAKCRVLIDMSFCDAANIVGATVAGTMQVPQIRNEILTNLLKGGVADIERCIAKTKRAADQARKMGECGVPESVAARFDAVIIVSEVMLSIERALEGLRKEDSAKRKEQNESHVSERA